MPSYKLNLAIVEGLPSMEDLQQAFIEHGQPECSEFGVLNTVASPSFTVARLYKRASKNIRALDDRGDVSVNEVADLKIIDLKIFDNGRVEVYSGTSATVQDVMDFLSELQLEVSWAAPSLDLAKAVQSLQSLPSFKIKRVTGKEHLGPEDADGAFTAKFKETPTALEFMEGKHGEHASAVAIGFKALNGRASITITPNGCFNVTCKEEDQPCLFDRCRDLVRVARRDEGV